MKYLIVVETINLHNQGWIEAYLNNVPDILNSYGGKYLISTASAELLEGEGEAPRSFVIVEFENKEKALSFYNSKEYELFKNQRLAGANCRTHLVPARIEEDS